MKIKAGQVVEVYHTRRKRTYRGVAVADCNTIADQFIRFRNFDTKSVMQFDTRNCTIRLKENPAGLAKALKHKAGDQGEQA